MVRATIFDIDGTLIDSVDLHALAWYEAFAHFGHDVPIKQVRSQIGKGGDNLLPAYLSAAQIQDHGKELEAWRSEHFKKNYLSLIQPFSAVPELLLKLRDSNVQIAVGSSAKADELSTYLDIAGITDLVDVIVSSEDVNQSKPAPDVFEVALKKLGADPASVMVIGDSPYDAQAANKIGLRTIGVLTGSFPEKSLLDAGCIAVYPGPAALYASFAKSPLAS
jgi:HAD superfamily hydrolase (TIGR01509 family)